MRQTFKLLAILLLFASCTPNYEKAIADWVQTDKNGTWTDMKFKLEKVYSTKDLTVADSINLLKARFDKAKKQAISECKRDIEIYETRLQFTEYAGTVDQIKSVREKLEKSKRDLNGFQTEEFHSPYAKRDTTEVLGKYLRCRYSFFSNRLNTEQKEDGIFFLTPDLKKCLGGVSNKFYELDRSRWEKW
jgi:radical SAM superfamily enzyme YgiQ (UPF0313 family)